MDPSNSPNRYLLYIATFLHFSVFREDTLNTYSKSAHSKVNTVIFVFEKEKKLFCIGQEPLVNKKRQKQKLSKYF